MQIKLWNKKWLVSEASNQEKLRIRRTGVGVVSKGATLELEDNIFNRILLGLDTTDIVHEKKYAPVNRESMNVAIREYQFHDVQHMLENRCTLNRNRPGYGKTFETIEYCRLLNLKRILIICPKSVVGQWKYQFSLWWPEVEQDVVVGGLGPKTGEYSIFVTNYEQMNRVQVWQRCKTWSWDIIILDESHRIKNPNAKVTKAIKGLPAQRRMCLTGTPILGRPNDLWSQLNFMDERLSGRSYWAFTERFCEVEENHFGKRVLGLTPSEGAKELLAKVLSLVTVGGENHKVTEGKNKIEIDLEMPPAMRNLYKAIVNLSFDQLDELGVTVKNAMDQIIKQQQCTTNIGSLLKEEDVGGGWKERAVCANPKFEWIRDWLEDNEGEKVVVYSKFAETVKALQKYLDEKKICKSVIYIGAMDGKARTASKEQFVQPTVGGARVLIGTIGALGTGVDGLQHVCRNVIFLDRDWTPGINEQAEDRVNRSGQVGMTNIWILHMKNSIDRYVEGIQTKKDDDIKELFEHVRNSIGSGE